jgi:hypothetical protein
MGGSLAAAALLVGVVNAGSAEAIDQCGVMKTSSTSGYAMCRQGPGHVTVKLTCNDPLRDSNSAFYGPRVTAPGTSKATCPYLGGVQTLVVRIDYVLSST